MAGQLIGRQGEVRAIMDNVMMRRGVLLVGAAGCGKTEILKFLASSLPGTVYADRLTPPKESLAGLAKGLNIDLGGKAQLAASLKEKILEKAHDKIFLLDHLEAVTPSLGYFLEELGSRVVIIGATSRVKIPTALTRFYSRLRRIDISNLPREDATKLIWQELDGTRVRDKRLIENMIYLKTGGNPLAIKDVARAFKDGGYNKEAIGTIEKGGGVKEVDLTPVLLIIGAVVISARFIALGLNDIDTYIMAGTFGAFFVFVRYFIYRSMRKG